MNAADGLTKTWSRGQTREDGYIFMRYQNRQNGAVYPEFISPYAYRRKLEWTNRWRLEDPDRAKAAVKKSRQKRRAISN